MPEVTTKAKSKRAAAKSPRFLGVVVKEDKRQREFKQAVSDWTKGRATYETVLKKNPHVAKPTFRDFIIYMLLGKR